MTNNLLLLHGALGNQHQFDGLKNQLYTDFQVHTLDFEGHGRTPTDRDFTIQLFTENVLAYLQEKNIQQAHVFGYSMGGYVALNLAKKHPEKVGRIVTLGTKLDWATEFAEGEKRKLNPAKIEEKVPQFADRLKTLYQPNDWKQVMEKTAGMMLYLAAVEKLTDADFWEIGHEILLNVGSLDEMVTHEETRHVAKLLPKGEMNVIEGARHAIERVDVGALTDTIIGFLKG